MAQQPNVELRPSDLPVESLDTDPPRRRDRLRPGLVLTPDQKPRGPGFGSPGPDTGFALRILAKAGVPEDSPRLRRVLAALMGARAAHFGRAPTPEDLQVALLVAGLGRHQSDDLDARRRRWEASAHEKAPGQRAVSEVGELLYQDPDHALLLMPR